jgi:signal transduction histidine kinase
MHDELSSSLAALKFYIEDEKSKAIGTTAEKSLSDITNEVSSVYKNARSYMHSLKTNNWETRFSLTGFLKEIQQKFSEKALMAVKLDIDEENIRLKLSTQQHDQLYHIIRESIANVIKHAGATELSIAINFKNDECIFNITDNGIGFEKGNIVQGIGIESMQKRIKDIEGELTFNSFIGGTTINGFFPVY